METAAQELSAKCHDPVAAFRLRGQSTTIAGTPEQTYQRVKVIGPDAPSPLAGGEDPA